MVGTDPAPAPAGEREPSTPTIGVLALQGAFARHVAALERCGAKAFEVRTADELARCQALVLPGGESTTMLKLLTTFELVEPLRAMLDDGLPTFGTCAGMILLARDVSDGRDDQISFGAIDIAVRRNGYGRQVDSFEGDLAVAAVGDPPLRAVFIRAPVVEKVGAEVEVLATGGPVDRDPLPVLCRQGPVLVSSFHPELVDDDRLHRYFLDRVVSSGPT